jgi:hypothetical protein
MIFSQTNVVSEVDDCQINITLDDFCCNLSCTAELFLSIIKFGSTGFFFKIAEGWIKDPYVTFSIKLIENLQISSELEQGEEICIIDYPRHKEIGIKQETNDNLTVWDYKNQILYSVSHKKQFQIVASTKENLERAFRRVLRMYLVAKLNSSGYISVHATGITLKNKAIIIIGGAGSGKTTLAFELMLSLGAKLLAPDKVFLKFQQDILFAVGEPGSLGIGPGTARRFNTFLDHFTDDITAKSTDELWKIDSPLKKARISLDSTVTSLISPANRNAVECITLIFPSIGRLNSTSISSLTKSKTIELIESNLLIGQRSFLPDWLNILPPPNTFLNNTRRFFSVFELSNNIKSFQLSFGDGSPLTCMLPLL